MLNFFNKRIGILLLIGIILTISSPWIFTRSIGFINFDNSGNIGSTIGGITAPITGLLGAFLIYYALIAQRQANKIQSKNNTIQLLLTLILDLENKCEHLEFIDEYRNIKKGIAAFNMISNQLYYSEIRPYMGEKTNKFQNDLMCVVNFGNYFNVITNSSLIYDFIVSAEIDTDKKAILQLRFKHIYTVFLSRSLNRLSEFYSDDLLKDNIKQDEYFETIIKFQKAILNNIF